MIELNKRSLNPQDPSLTWEEVNENWRIIEDYLNNHVSVAGPQGPQGPQGYQGYRGYQGYKGDTGATGPQGATFIPSYDEESGDLSWICDNPFILPPATVNISGPQGEKGEPGEKGEKGDDGEPGPQGEPGSKGDTGSQGPQGEPGDTQQHCDLTITRGGATVETYDPVGADKTVDIVGKKTTGEIFNDYSGNVASGNYSHAHGQGTTALGNNQTAFGKFNIPDNNSLLLVGNGIDTDHRANALKLDSDGNLAIPGNAEIGTPLSIDMTDYASKEWVLSKGYIRAINIDGIEGFQGPQGETGATGPQGDQGFQGEPGNDGDDGEQGPRGATFTPSVNVSGYLSWTCDDPDLELPQTRYIRGPKGDTGSQGRKGDQGARFTPTVDENCNLSWECNDPDLELPQTRNIKGDTGSQGTPGAPGPQGEKGDQGARFTPSIDENFILSWTCNDESLELPNPVNIKGPQGEPGPPGGPQGEPGTPGQNGQDGEDGATFTPSIDENFILSWECSDQDLPVPNPVNIKGDKGDKGDKGENGQNGKDGKDGKDGKNGEKGDQGEDGATFTPSIDENFILSWECSDQDLPVPNPVNIKGAPGTPGQNGQNGQDGATFTPSIDENFNLSWECSDPNLNVPQTVNVKGPTGDQGATFTPSVSTSGILSWTCSDPNITPPQARNIKGPTGATGPRGATFTPSVDEDSGVLSWTCSDQSIVPPPNVNIKGPAGATGHQGATFTPSIDENFILSWECSDQDLPVPNPVNIKGPKGDDGNDGAQGPRGYQGYQGAQGASGEMPFVVLSQTSETSVWTGTAYIPGFTGLYDGFTIRCFLPYNSTSEPVTLSLTVDTGGGAMTPTALPVYWLYPDEELTTQIPQNAVFTLTYRPRIGSVGNPIWLCNYDKVGTGNVIGNNLTQGRLITGNGDNNIIASSFAVQSKGAVAGGGWDASNSLIPTEALISDYFQPLDTDLSKIAALTGSGYPYRNSNGNWSLSDISGYQPLDDDLTAIAELTGSGYLRRNNNGTWNLGVINLSNYVTTSDTFEAGEFLLGSPNKSAYGSGLLFAAYDANNYNWENSNQKLPTERLISEYVSKNYQHLHGGLTLLCDLLNDSAGDSGYLLWTSGHGWSLDYPSGSGNVYADNDFTKDQIIFAQNNGKKVKTTGITINSSDTLTASKYKVPTDFTVHTHVNSYVWSYVESTCLKLTGGTMTGQINSRNIIPSAGGTYNLGASDKPFNELWVGDIKNQGGEMHIVSSYRDESIPATYEAGVYISPNDNDHGGDTVEIEGKLSPQTNNRYDLGDSNYNWRNLFLAGSLYLRDTQTSNFYRIQITNGQIVATNMDTPVNGV